MAIRIAVDAMGGDHAPAEVIAGAVEAAKSFPVTLVLFGPEAVIQTELTRHKGVPGSLHVVHAPETIDFSEAPVQAVRHKRDSSLVKAITAVKEDEADAIVSAGSTGALLAGGLLLLGRLPGIERPALATAIPTLHGVCLVLDVGANTDNSPESIGQFAAMGAVYAEHVLKLTRPRIGLLNNGTEESKGSVLTKAAHGLLQAGSLNYIGYVEARAVFEGVADVIVTDGFTGNVFLKTLEGTSQTVMGLVREQLTSSPWHKLGALFLRNGLRQVGRRLDYSEYGGAPFLGVQGAVIKCHGSSKARAIYNGIRVAYEFVQGRCLERMSQTG